jgi:ribosomal-protein-alanine N-acetyltransferase
VWLLTPRLTLSRPTPADTDAIYRIHSDPRTYEHAPAGRMTTRTQAADLADAWVRHWEAHGFGYAAVRFRDETEVVGFAGVKCQVVDGAQVLNLYYRFAPESWGVGLASEAAGAIVAWAAARHPRLAVIARTAVDNPRSQRVAERIGLVRQEFTDPNDPTPHYLFSDCPAAAGRAGVRSTRVG